MKKIALIAVALLLWASWRRPPPLQDGVALSRAVFDSTGRLLRLSLAQDGRYRLWTPLADLSPRLVAATLAREDRHFRSHPGVNPAALLRSAWHSYALRDRRLGGSTVTMQLARLRGRLDTKSPSGKVRQILHALQLEWRYTKDEILEAYLNLAPYGGNVEGAAAASLVYFGKEASGLSSGEAALLARVPQNPLKRGRRPAGLPFLAPHVTSAPGPPGRQTATLDLELQKLVERQTKAYLERRRSHGLRNASVLLVDRRSLEVKALLGSADFFDASLPGQVDGTLARRSPGSTLKPFIYGLALDQGLMHPQTMLKDAPSSFGPYHPENFDGDFLGPIKAKDALIRSRNIPAVQLASQLAQPSLYDFLKDAGVALPQAEEHYGLGLALGAAEVSMRELVELYAMLGNGGVLRPLRLYKEQAGGTGKRLLSREASFIVLDMLKDNPRPAQGFREEWTLGKTEVSWKTGTSFGFRDAWSVGLFGPYVLAVWVGDFSGEGHPSYIGSEAAAPLFFAIADALKAGRPMTEMPAAQRLGVSRVEVCAVSGSLPTKDCPRSLMTWFIPGKSPIAPCGVHRKVAGKVYEFWPSDLAKLFAQAGLPRRAPPGAAPDQGRGRPPQITSPLAGVGYRQRLEGPKEPLTLTAVVDGDARRVFWFADQAFLGQAESGEPLFWTPRPGKFVVRAVDDQGRSDWRELKVAVSE